MIATRWLYAASLAAALVFNPTAAQTADQLEKGARIETAKYVSRDFSGPLWPRTNILGFIGPDFQRLKITFTAIRQDAHDPALYHLRGTSSVRGNSCDFDGTLHVTTITTWTKQYSFYEEYTPLQPRAVGEFHATYELRENPAQPSTGVFKGRMVLGWFINRDGQLLYDEVIPEDGYRNNQYEGTWTSYKTGQSKTANWGDFRIPGSGDLDTGVGEFLPNEKYRKNGWDDPEWSPQPSKD